MSKSSKNVTLHTYQIAVEAAWQIDGIVPGICVSKPGSQIEYMSLLPLPERISCPLYIKSAAFTAFSGYGGSIRSMNLRTTFLEPCHARSSFPPRVIEFIGMGSLLERYEECVPGRGASLTAATIEVNAWPM